MIWEVRAKSIVNSQEKSMFLIFCKLNSLCRNVASQIFLEKGQKKAEC